MLQCCVCRLSSVVVCDIMYFGWTVRPRAKVTIIQWRSHGGGLGGRVPPLVSKICFWNGPNPVRNFLKSWCTPPPLCQRIKYKVCNFLWPSLILIKRSNSNGIASLRQVGPRPTEWCSASVPVIWCWCRPAFMTGTTVVVCLPLTCCAVVVPGHAI